MNQLPNARVANTNEGQVDVHLSSETLLSSKAAQQTTNDLLARLLQNARQSEHRVNFHLEEGNPSGSD